MYGDNKSQDKEALVSVTPELLENRWPGIKIHSIRCETVEEEQRACPDRSREETMLDSQLSEEAVRKPSLYFKVLTSQSIPSLENPAHGEQYICSQCQ